MIENNSRQCIDCKEIKDLSEFPLIVPSKRKKNRMPVQGRCRPCQSVYRRKYRNARPKERQLEDRKQALKRYGITIEEYDILHDAQKGLCAICQSPERALSHKGDRIKLLAVDHCHRESKIRGLLCQDCNTALGLFKDNPDLLHAAIQYLAGNINTVGVAS